jgi:acid phosphatase
MKLISQTLGRRRRRQAVATLVAASLYSAALTTSASADDGRDSVLRKINHFVIIYQENWSFDSLYGQFPGVNGLQNGFDNLPQLDKSTGYASYIYQTPQVLNSGATDSRFPPANGQPALPLIPYDFTKYVPASGTTGDIIHRFYHQQLQIDNGVLEPSKAPMSKFVTWSDNPGLVLSYVDATTLPEGKLAQKYTICDNFFHSAYGGSFLNHQFLVAAAAPKWRQPIPAGFQSAWTASTMSLSDGNLTIDGQYVVNTTYGAQTPHPSTAAAKLLLPINNVDPTQPDYMPTIGNRLDDAGLSWKWYSGGWNNALAGNPDPLFQFHHQPFGYYAKYAPFNADGTLNPATTGPAAHLQDEQVFLSDLSAGTLPSVSFVKPLGPDNEHPGYASLSQGQQHVADLVSAVQRSQYGRDTLIIITYDENGGRWDHVQPPNVDSWGVGTRVPTILISPFTKGGNIDSKQNETVSILKLIERRYKLAPLSARDANPAVNDLTEALSSRGGD